MMPKDLERVQYYNRHNHDEYVYWLLDRCNEGLAPYGEKLSLQTLMLLCGSRESVDEMVSIRLSNLDLEKPIIPMVEGEIIDDFKPKPEPIPEPEVVEEKPTWVEAAEEVLEIAEEEEEEGIMIVPADDNPFGDVDYHSWTVRELQDECREREITIRGTKAEVVLRLRQADEGILTQETEGETEAPSEEAAEDLSDAPVDDTAATEEVTQNDNSGQQGEDSSEEE
jgi:hypothetical protein